MTHRQQAAEPDLRPAQLDHYQLESERIKFEAWASDFELDLTRASAMTAFFLIDYLSGRTQTAWAGWTARARIAL